MTSRLSFLFSSLSLSLRAAARNKNRSLNRNRCLSSSRKGDPLPPLPSSSTPKLSSPSQAKAKYMESQKATEKYLNPQEKIQQNFKEIELVREQAVAKLESELKKSIYNRLTDPLKNHKHSLYNVLAMTLAYLLAHNLFLTSKKEKEARLQLLESQQMNDDLKLLIESLLQESAVNEMAENCVRQMNEESNNGETNPRSSWWKGVVSVTQSDQKTVEGKLRFALRNELEARIGHVSTASDEERKQQSIEEIMQQNQEKVKELNENPAFLLQQALEIAEGKVEGETGNKKQRRVFNM